MNFISLISLIFYIFSQCDSETVEHESNNWTTCEEFLNNSIFDTSSVLDIDWKIFFFWNHVEDKSYNVRFSLATPMLVDRFKVELKRMDSSINWSNAVLFMETSIDFSALYLKTEIPGQFRLIPTFAFQGTGNVFWSLGQNASTLCSEVEQLLNLSGDHFTAERIPFLIFALKLVPPGYLGIMNCQHKLCYALAPVDKMPEDKNITLSAQTLGFRGNSNYSYLMQYDIRHVAAYNEDDVDEDEQVEVANEMIHLTDD